MKKFLPYILMFTIAVGLLSPMFRVHADSPWYFEDQVSGTNTIEGPFNTYNDCNQKTASGTIIRNCFQSATAPAVSPAGTQPAGNNGNALSDSLKECSLVAPTQIDGCAERVVYWVFYSIPSFLLGVAANFFNVIVSLTISSAIYAKATFISNAWRAVRDFSNIFFIIILLYVSIELILGIGHDTKKVIAQVVLMALLINFSMFFTEIIIDSANILALIFYNKITVVTNNNGQTTNYIPVLSQPHAGVQDKDLSGGLMSYFDPTKLLSQDFFNKFRKTTVEISTKGVLASAATGALIGSAVPIIGTGIGTAAGVVGYFLNSSTNEIPIEIIMGFIVTSGLIIAFAAYAFFIAGLAFLSRMIELWILIIFSPFAFMSSSVPFLSGFESIGWKEWSKRLFDLAFMAPIFMFFMYLIFKIIQSDIFAGLTDRTPANQGWMETMILIIIPALVILILLYKATKKAKKASGELGAMVIKGTEVAMGAAFGLATGGAASLGQKYIGGAAASISESNRMRDFAARSKFGAGLQRGLSGLATSEFDVRKGAVGGVLKAAGGISGLNLGHTSKFLMRQGGYLKDRADRVKKDEEFANKQLDTTDYGKAELTRGRMNATRARQVERQLIRGGMTVTAAAGHRASLMTNGIDVGDVANVARYLDAAKREVYADRLDRRSNPTVFGNFYGPAQRINARKRISANKIRKDAGTATKQANINAAMAAWAAAGGATSGATGGATGGGAKPHP